MSLHLKALLVFAVLTVHLPCFSVASDFTTETITVQIDPSTTVTRQVLTVKPVDYLNTVATTLPEPNASIVRILKTYPTDGSHDYWWPKRGEGNYDGATTDIVVNGQTVMTGEPKGRTFCCGLTLEVYYRYLQSAPKLSTASAALDHKDFKGNWFCKEINSPGPLDALSKYQLGTAITNWDEARPGDFVQLWRTNRSGHSVIFINWVYSSKGDKIGIQYWSTQIPTSGIGYRTELFGNMPGVGLVDPDRLSIARPSILN